MTANITLLAVDDAMRIYDLFEKFSTLNQGLLKDGQESFSKIYKLFFRRKAKTTLKLSVAMPNSRLHTNFQLNIFIFEARVSFQTLLQSLKQNSDK